MKALFIGLSWLLILACSSISLGQSLDWASAKELHPGIRLIQIDCLEPRPMKIHAVKIDLTTPRLALHSTPRAEEWVENESETIRQTTRDYLVQSQSTDRKLVFAANADFFTPWPLPYHLKNPSNLGGLAVSGGALVSPAEGTPSLLITKSGEASIQLTTRTTKYENVEMAVSGFGLCLSDSVVQPSGTDLHPRTGVGLSDDGKFLFVVAIDGRRRSSQGATTQELGEWLKKLGADDAINMDGGGSTTLVWWNPESDKRSKCELINSPVGNGERYETAEAEAKYTPTERANGNNFGVYYRADTPN